MSQWTIKTPSVFRSDSLSTLVSDSPGTARRTYLRVPAQKHMEAEGLLPTGKLADLAGPLYDLREPVSLEALKA